MNKETRKKLLVIVLAGSLAVALGEAALRVAGYGAAAESLEPFDLYYFRDRPDHLRDQRTAFAYEPDSSVRQVVVVVTKHGRAIEYDTTLTTNNLGLVQKRNLSPGESAVVVIGDSFTEGVGAPPWFYELEAEIGGEFRLANLGVVGTGAQHWESSLSWFAEDHRVAGLVVAFIAEDLQRPRSWWKRVDGSIVNCFDDHCSNPMARLPYRDSDFAPFTHEQAPAWKRIAKDLLQATRVGELVLRAKRSMFPGAARTDRPNAGFYEAQFREGLRAFDRIAEKFPAAVFLHLPMAEEARSQAWLDRSPKIREHLRALGSRYRDGMRECGLEGSDYHPHDPHPNADGYRKIRRCVAQIVRRLPTT
jgi:hypothetical protein